VIGDDPVFPDWLLLDEVIK